MQNDQSVLLHPVCAENWTGSPEGLTDFLRAWLSIVLMRLPTVLAIEIFSMPSSLIGELHEDRVIDATRRIGRLVEIIEGTAAAAELDRRAKKAATEVARVGRLTVREGNPGDDAANNWTAAMMGLYRMITGKEPATGLPRNPMRGLLGGPSFVSSKPWASR